MTNTQLKAVTDFGSTLEVKLYAGFWLRVWASVADSVVLYIPTLVIMAAFQPNISEWRLGREVGWVGAVVLGVFWLLYQGILESSTRQATFGKQLVGIFVVDYYGKRISFTRAVWRAWPAYFFYFVIALASLVGSLGLDMFAAIATTISCAAVAFTAHKQGLHDLMAKCLIVRRGSDLSGLWSSNG